ncbi:MAG: phage holin family protein [Bacteroidota bacterium]|nr:phage holin family protein [Bacteroidota bacterium]
MSGDKIGDKQTYMENKPTSVEELFYKLKDYGDTRLDLLKLKGINKVSSFLSLLIVSVVLIVLLFLVLICITIGLSLIIGALLGKAFYGFFIMAVIYIIIGLVLFSGRKKLLQNPVSDKLIKELLD